MKPRLARATRWIRLASLVGESKKNRILEYPVESPGKLGRVSVTGVLHSEYPNMPTMFYVRSHHELVDLYPVQPVEGGHRFFHFALGDLFLETVEKPVPSGEFDMQRRPGNEADGISDVVAPPISSGSFNFLRSISAAV